jgi:2,5-diamino-6-(ribosylamino)-4(3H)-pyrimidinone 5'-phosphate reductase
MLNSKYNVRTVLVDSGGILAGVLVRQGLVNEISLIISPVIAGNRSQNLFRTFENKVNLDLIKADRLKGNHVLVVYRVLRNITS